MGAIGSIIGGASSLLGGLFQGNQSVKAQKLANESNERIARENNRWQRENMQMQNDWNIEQWNRENEYNSASAQAQRFREAGLNPYLAMTGGASAGTASSVTSADAGQASEVGRQLPIDYSAYNGVLNTLSQLPLQIAQAENLGAATDKQQAEANVAKATAEQLGIENFYKSHIMRLTTKKMIQDLDIGESYKKQMLVRLDDMERENALLGDYEVNNARKQTFVQQAYLVGAEAGLASVREQLGKKELKWFDPQAQARVKEILANAARAIAAAGLDKKMSEKVVVETALAGFDEKIKDAIGIKGIHRIAASTVRQVEEQSYKTRTDRIYAPFNYITRGASYFVPW